ncbi:MAG: histone deacetylase/AcuC/AphA family protein [Nitrospinae bacterium]|nr:histone deacetylase/AcuC/AphA family protein [Nitrospinota bacterium]
MIPALRQFAPELILVSAGFDGHRDDPLGGLTLTERGYGDLTALLVGVAAELGHGRIVSTLEGGYNYEALAASAVAHVEQLAAGIKRG